MDCCTICQKEIKPNHKKSKRNYCSMTCRNKGFSLFPNRKRKGENLICPACNREFYVINSLIKIRKYCSRKCYPGYPKRGINRICKTCGNKFYISQVFKKSAKYCSRECHNEAMKIRTIKKCNICGKDYEVRISQIKWRGSKYCSRNCTEIAASKRTKELSPSWIDGRSYKNNKIRKGIKWKRWRKAVFERDNYTCQKCGARSSKGKAVELNPHHIKSFNKYPQKRYVIKNGLTVCRACHYKIHSKRKTRDTKTHNSIS